MDRYSIALNRPLPPDTFDPKEIPSNLEKSLVWLDHYIERKGERKDFEEVLKKSEEFLSMTHHGIGSFIRNEWHLWETNSLTEFFNKSGIHHADDMSGIILTSFYRRHKGKDIGFHKQVEYYKKYWAEVENGKVNYQVYNDSLITITPIDQFTTNP